MENFEAKDAWLVVDGKKVMNLNINDEQFYGWGDLAIKKNGLKSMKYVKYGHGKWMPKYDPSLTAIAKSLSHFFRSLDKAMRIIAKHYKI